MTPQELHFIRHATGDLTMYRNRFVATNGGDDFVIGKRLESMGYAVTRKYPLDEMGDSTIFQITDAGIKAAKEEA